jgi:hypothetical protein
MTADEDGVDRLRGKRRLEEADRRPPLVVFAVLAGLGLAVAVPLVMVSLPPRDDAGTGPVLSSAGGAPLVVGSGSSTPEVSTPSPIEQRAPHSSAAMPSRVTPSRVPPPTPGPPAFTPVTYEAEAAGNTLSGSAWVTTYPGASGGSIVRNIGDWGSAADGSLRFNSVLVPAGAVYSLTFRYVDIDNERNRTAVITVPGSAPIEVTVAGGSVCCALATVNVPLKQGQNSITFTNPIGHAPSIDNIVIALP